MGYRIVETDDDTLSDEEARTWLHRAVQRLAVRPTDIPQHPIQQAILRDAEKVRRLRERLERAGLSHAEIVPKVRALLTELNRLHLVEGV